LIDELKMHAPVYLAICATAIVMLSTFGNPNQFTMVVIAAASIAALGVPHGGLDHWTGRNLLVNRFAGRWWLMFFPLYLVVAVIAGLGWIAAPSLTLLLFFLLSAWHFGREDQKVSSAERGNETGRRLFRQLQAVAVGGLVIWIPAVVRGEEFYALLATILPPENRGAAITIVRFTRSVAIVLIPLAIGSVVAGIIARPTSPKQWVPIGTIAMSIGLPILLSFSIYFSFWHSWQGLRRLRREQSLSTARFALSVAPLSVAAVVMIGLSGTYLHGIWTTGHSQWNESAALRTIFIGLSAIAVPHVLLHESHGFCSKLLGNREDQLHSHAMGG
jgi:Brp/Blh family beta-carotene 15,15'-monooxygenase